MYSAMEVTIPIPSISKGIRCRLEMRKRPYVSKSIAIALLNGYPKSKKDLNNVRVIGTKMSPRINSIMYHKSTGKNHSMITRYRF